MVIAERSYIIHTNFKKLFLIILGGIIMSKLFKTLTSIVIITFIISSSVIPVSAVESRGIKYCPYCITQKLTVLSQYEIVETVRMSCDNTAATGYVHDHYFFYLCEECVCPKCGYEVIARTENGQKCVVSSRILDQK